MIEVLNNLFGCIVLIVLFLFCTPFGWVGLLIYFYMKSENKDKCKTCEYKLEYELRNQRRKNHLEKRILEKEKKGN